VATSGTTWCEILVVPVLVANLLALGPAIVAAPSKPGRLFRAP